MVISCRPERISLRPICDILSKRRNEPLFIAPKACPVLLSKIALGHPIIGETAVGQARQATSNRTLASHRSGAALHLQQRSATAAARVARRSNAVIHSEVRLVSSRECGVFFGAVFMWVFRTDVLGPAAEYAPIRFGRRPSGGEDTLVLDRELEL